MSGPIAQDGPPAEPPGTPLLPPRPNLGPEPWSDPPGPGPLELGAAVALAVGVAAAAVVLIQARRRWRSEAGARPGPSAILEAAEAEGLTDADRLLRRAEALREALISAFGPSWAARTTEEVAAAPVLAERLGPEGAARVVALLGAADRAKFAGIADDQGGPEESSWLGEAIASLSAPARPRSSTIGK